MLLIQVDDNAGVEAARQTLARLGIAPSAIAVHTSDEPDPDVIAMARGEDKEVLIFKVAVALGFDAPRAFTLVSMRTVRDADLGTQIVGRLLRVEPRLRAIPIEGPNVDALRRLDEAHVYLAPPRKPERHRGGRREDALLTRRRGGSGEPDRNRRGFWRRTGYTPA